MVSRQWQQGPRRRLTLSLFAGAIAAAGFWYGSEWQARRSGDRTAERTPLPLLQPLMQVGARARTISRNNADFESGNIGAIERSGPLAWRLWLRSDNDDAQPKYWRQWFYLRLDDLPLGQEVTMTLEGAGQRSYYLPFYSYDNIEWTQFKPEAVTKPTPTTLRMISRFTHKTVWLARYVPYSYARLNKYLERIASHPAVKVADIGRSPLGHLVPMITIAEPSAAPKQRVLLHARTHPGEVGSSFLLEGLINFLLLDTPTSRALRSRLVFTIVPMLNVDGVIAGNNRTTPSGINLEGKWREGDGLYLDEHEAPPEVLLMNQEVRTLLATGVPVSMALNLHSSAGEPADNVFIFPHFGPPERGYSVVEAKLFAKQIKFISLLVELCGRDLLNPPVADGHRDFLAKDVPESWWWRHFRDQVLALTIESTYGLLGKSGRWTKPDDMRRLGAAMAVAIGRYHGMHLDCRRSEAKALVSCR